MRKAVRERSAWRKEIADLVWHGRGHAKPRSVDARIRRRYPLRRIHGFVIERREVARVTNTLIRATPAAPPDGGLVTADILPAAAVVIDEVMDLTGAATLTVSGQGLREGLVWQELRGENPVIADVRAASIAGLARANGVDEFAAEPVVNAAAALFEATESVHGYGPAELELLLSAARLAGIGMHVDYYNRDRHAEYLVHSGDLRGFDHREILLLAALVRWSIRGHSELALPDHRPGGRCGGR